MRVGAGAHDQHGADRPDPVPRSTLGHGPDRAPLPEIEAKVYAGERLTRADGAALYRCDDLVLLGRLAHHRRGGDDRSVTFVMSRDLSLTNVCSASCAYCAFRRKPGEHGAYTLEVGEVAALAAELAGDPPAQLRLVNGLHPTMPWRYYPEVLREVRAALPGVWLAAFTATEIHWFEKISGRPAGEILDELIDAGMDTLTGGGGDIFDREVRQQLVDHATGWEDWSRIHRLAHQRGLRTSATMLYGHVESPRHQLDHLLRLRALQDETGGFVAFTPLRYADEVAGDDPAGAAARNRLRARATPASPAQSLRTIAVSRLLLDNVPHLDASIATHGASLASLALRFGADDLDSSSVGYRGATQAGHGVADAMPREDLLELIRDADFRPVERDGRYGESHRYEAPPSLAERRSRPQQVWS